MKNATTFQSILEYYYLLAQQQPEAIGITSYSQGQLIYLSWKKIMCLIEHVTRQLIEQRVSKHDRVAIVANSVYHRHYLTPMGKLF